MDTQLNIQLYLKNRDSLGVPFENTLEDLKTKLGIYTNRHKDYPNLIQFSYDMIESPKNNEIVNECRGLILDQDNHWKVVAYPFKRFANFGESWAAPIYWPTARIQEKVDGTLIIMYFYNNEWHVATRGSADAGGSVGDFKKNTGELWTFRDLFWYSCEYWLKGLCKDGNLNPHYTYTFELTSPLNRIVCDYTKTGISEGICHATGETIEFEDDHTGYAHDGSRITLIGVRNNLSLTELSVAQFKEQFHYVVEEFKFNTMEDVLTAAEQLDPKKQEGFVVVDAFFNRVKIKSPKYVVLHHLISAFTLNKLIELIKFGEATEFVSYFPEYKNIFNVYDILYSILCKKVDEDFDYVTNFVGSSATQKEFASEACKQLVPDYLFQRRKGKVDNPQQYFKDVSSDKLLPLLDHIRVKLGMGYGS